MPCLSLDAALLCCHGPAPHDIPPLARSVVQGLSRPLTPPVPHCQAQRACLEMLRSASQLPAHSVRGAGALGWRPVFTGGWPAWCAGTEAEPLALCSRHGSVLAIHLGSLMTDPPWDIFCSACFLGTLGGGLKQKFRQQQLESLLSQLEGVSGKP